MLALLIAVGSPLQSSRPFDGPLEAIAVASDDAIEAPVEPRATIVPPRVDATPPTHPMRKSRAGLFIAGGVFMQAVSTTLRFVQHVELGNHRCDDTSSCSALANPGLTIATIFVTTLVTDPASAGLVGVGAARIGEADAERMSSGQKRSRGQVGYLAGGGTMVAVGIAGVVATYAIWLTSVAPSQGENFAREGGRLFASGLIVAGVGLVAYGSALPEYRLRGPTRTTARLQPSLSRRHVGVALSWRY